MRRSFQTVLTAGLLALLVLLAACGQPDNNYLGVAPENPTGAPGTPSDTPKTPDVPVQSPEDNKPEDPAPPADGGQTAAPVGEDPSAADPVTQPEDQNPPEAQAPGNGGTSEPPQAPENTENTETGEPPETPEDPPAPEDGQYTAAVTLAGGSGRATVSSPAQLRCENGQFWAVIVWSSPNFDYMKVDGVKYELLAAGGNSTFEIPVAAFDQALPVNADTIAMSEPHEVEYTLTFDSATLEKQ